MTGEEIWFNLDLYLGGIRMTEKRFTDIEHDFENARIRCKDDGLLMLYAIYEDDDGLDTLGNLLNGLDSDVKDLKKENEQLKYTLGAYMVDLNNCKGKCSALEIENGQLKQTIKEVTELLEEEVDLFSDKATEHDINAYIELKELDNKDAYYMAISTKKAIKMLKGDVE